MPKKEPGRDQAGRLYCRTYFELRRAIEKAKGRYEDTISKPIPLETMVEYALIHFALLSDEDQIEAARKGKAVLQIMAEAEADKPLDFEELKRRAETPASSVVEPPAPAPATRPRRGSPKGNRSNDRTDIGNGKGQARGADLVPGANHAPVPVERLR